MYLQLVSLEASDDDARDLQRRVGAVGHVEAERADVDRDREVALAAERLERDGKADDRAVGERCVEVGERLRVLAQRDQNRDLRVGVLCLGQGGRSGLGRTGVEDDVGRAWPISDSSAAGDALRGN